MSIDTPQVATLDDRISSALNDERSSAVDISSDDDKNGLVETTATSGGATAWQNEELKPWSDDGCCRVNTVDTSGDEGNCL
jgi:hypothetical protein